MKISKELTVSVLTFNGGTGEQYVKPLEDFELILHKKGLCAMYKKYEANQDVHQTDFDLHKLGKP